MDTTGNRTELRINLRVNLPSLSGGLHRQLQGLMNFVALGIQAAESYTAGSLSLPDVDLPHTLSNAPELWDSERLRGEFKQWILASGVRDAIEAFSVVLEKAREILAAWSLSLEGEEIPIDRWNTQIIAEGRAFHRKGLPEKLDFIRSKYSVSLPASKEDYLLSINRARNCLVHRGSIVSFQDISARYREIDDAIGSRRASSPTEPWTPAQTVEALQIAGIDPFLKVHWLRLQLFVEREGNRTYLDMRKAPHDVGGGVLGVEVKLAERSFGLGETVTFDANEFSEIAWTLSTCARNLTEAVEKHGRQLGVPFEGEELTNNDRAKETVNS